MFPTNEGTIDRVLRIILGFGLIAAYFIYPDSACLFLGVLDRCDPGRDRHPRLVPALFDLRHQDLQDQLIA
ncbi:MAG: DUF2892 domain-containing protein [Maritimibacter sp.]